MLAEVAYSMEEVGADVVEPLADTTAVD